MYGYVAAEGKRGFTIGGVVDKLRIRGLGGCIFIFSCALAPNGYRKLIHCTPRLYLPGSARQPFSATKKHGHFISTSKIPTIRRRMSRILVASTQRARGPHHHKKSHKTQTDVTNFSGVYIEKARLPSTYPHHKKSHNQRSRWASAGAFTFRFCFEPGPTPPAAASILFRPPS